MDSGGTAEPSLDHDDSAVVIRRLMTRVVIAVAVLTMVGLVVLWPRGEAPDLGIQPGTYVDATVVEVDQTECPAVEADALTNCQRATVDITSGPDSGQQGVVLIRETDFRVPELSDGDRLVLLDVPTSPPPFRYTFADYQRASPMWALLALFVIAVLAVGRWQGLRALSGLVASGIILVAFVVPALLRDESAILVALTGTVAIAFLALYLAHGVNRTTTVALAGTLLSLMVIVVLAIAAAEFSRLSGLADADAQALRVTAAALDLRGLLVAGIVVGALGVLDDVTVTQVSTVAALRRADPAMPRTALYREAMRVGRDHVASVVNTLVLAYAGAALPLILLFTQGTRPAGRIVTSEVVAVEVTRMLVGSLGLILAVPITTALAAAVLGSAEDPHAGHSHGPDPLDPQTRPRRARRGSGRGDEAGPRWEDFGPEEHPV
jgi:uncharacterized membrane protein